MSTQLQAHHLHTADWLTCEPLIRRFENAWRQGPQPNIADFAPADPRTRLAVLFELILTDMEFRFKGDKRLRVESYLERFPELQESSELLVELVAAEWDLRRELEPDLAINEYLQRFPAYSAELLQHLNGPHAKASVRTFQATELFKSSSDNAQDLSFPQIPGFQIVSVLGHGATGVVFEAVQQSLGRSVAIKMLRSSLLDSSLIERVRSEAEAAAALQHENIVQIHFIGEHDGRPFLAFEMVRGKTLEAAWSASVPDHRSVATAIETLARAVHCAHQRGIVHRDLKPANVLVDESGRLRITDFGMAKGMNVLESTTLTGEILGTPAYMSPEQASGNSKRVGPTTDCYSLGAILFRGMTGVPPFSGSNPIDTMALIRWSEPIAPRRLLPSVPVDLNTICLKCLNKLPQDRYATALELADDMRRFLNGEPILARRTSLMERAMMWCRRRPAVAAMVMMLVAVFCIGSGLVFQQWRQAVASLSLANQREQERMSGLVDSFLTASPESAPSILATIRKEGPEIASFVKERKASIKSDQKSALFSHRVHLLNADEDWTRYRELGLAMISAEPAEFVFLRDELHRLSVATDPGSEKKYHAFLVDTLLKMEKGGSDRFHALLALAKSNDDGFWKQHSNEIADCLLAANPLHVPIYYSALRPLQPPLSDALATISADSKRSSENRVLAARLLSDAWVDKATELLELFLKCDDEQFPVLVEKLRPMRESVLPRLREIISEDFPSQESSETLDMRVRYKSNAALALFMMGESEVVWPLFRESERPDLQTSLIHRLSLTGVELKQIFDRIAIESQVSIRRALILAAGEFQDCSKQLQTDSQLIEMLLKSYRNDPDSGVHGATLWLLQKCKFQQQLAKLDREIAKEGVRPDCNWYITTHGHSMAIIRGPVKFVMGVKPESMPIEERQNSDRQRGIEIRRSWAVSMTEISRQEYQEYLQYQSPTISRHIPNSMLAQSGVTWYDAAKYCRWLSEQESLEEDEMCYPVLAQIKSGMLMPKNYLHRNGYRLPTEAEWEYSCRANTDSKFYFGDSIVF